MNKNFSISNVFLVLCIALFLLGLVFVGTHNSRGKPGRTYTLGNVVVLRKEITDSIQQKGPQSAYDELVAQLKTVPASITHTSMHVFGEVLFVQKGVTGIDVCDTSFGFGCYHGFFGKAVSVRGAGIVTELDSACVARFGPVGLGCPHGIGHGLGEYFGPGKLVQQLTTCATLSWQGTYHGCSSGVFMEYNYPTLVGSDNAVTTTRAMTKTDPLAPCFWVPRKFQNSCLFELPAWWWDVLNHDVKQMGTLCQAIGEDDVRESCFLGIGAGLTPRINYVLPDIVANCRLMPDASSETSCRAGAAWTFFADPTYRERADSVCQGLSTENMSVCSERYQRISRGE